MTRGGVAVVRTVALSLALALVPAGCGKKKTDDTGGGAPPGPGPGGMPGMGPGGPTAPQDVLSKLPGGDEFAAGKKVYADNNCARCHKLGDTGGGGVAMNAPPAGAPLPAGGGSGGWRPGGPSAPDLTKVGAAPEHTKQWLAEQIRDAKKHKPDSKMPEHGPDKISDADLNKLTDYLASRK